MVFSWVDGTIAEFERDRAKRMQAYVVGEGDDSEARYRQIDELKYALRSVYMFAPWMRRIFIATDSPASGLARRPPAGHHRAQRGVLRRPLGAADPQLARRREPAAPHPGPRRALPVLERRHVLRSPAVARDVLLARRDHEVHRGDHAHRPRRATTRRAAASRTPPASTARCCSERFGAVTTRHLEHAPRRCARACMTEIEASSARSSPHRRQPVPLGHRHLGDELAVPLLRAA